MRRFSLTDQSECAVCYCFSAHCEQTAGQRLYKPVQQASESEQRAAQNQWAGGSVGVFGGCCQLELPVSGKSCRFNPKKVDFTMAEMGWVALPLRGSATQSPTTVTVTVAR